MPFPEQQPDVPDIQPFWLRLPRFFLYPLQIDPLLYMFFLSLATLLSLVVSRLFAILILLVIMVVFIRYAYEVLDRTADGLLTPDLYVPSNDSDRSGLPYKQFAIFVVIGLVIGLARSAGGLVFGAALIYGTLSMPAASMILAITRSLGSALNPFAVLQMISSIGMPYLGLCAFIFLLSASQSVLQSFLAPRVPQWLLFPSLAFVAMYFTLIMFNMMGYVIYQYHDVLGVRVRNAGKGGTAGKGNHGNRAAGSDEPPSYAELIAAGRIDQALDLAYEEKRVDPENVAANDRYHKLLLLSDREERLLSHTRSYLTLLLKKNLAAEALGLYRVTRERTPDFEPDEPAQLLRLAEAARRQRDFTLALSLIKGFDKRFPGNKEIPAVYFFAAQTLCENLHQDAMARRILTTLLERYPAHAVSGQARQLLDVIDKLAARP